MSATPASPRASTGGWRRCARALLQRPDGGDHQRPGAKPNAAWLNFVVTGKARANVRGYLKNLQRQEAEALGRRMLNAELARFGLDLDASAMSVIAAYGAQVGLPARRRCSPRSASAIACRLLVARRLAGADARAGAPAGRRSKGSPRRLAIRGTEGMVVNFARCCRPIPGDQITGLFSPGKGIVVHRCECRNLGEFQSKRDKWLEVEWADDPKAEFATEIRVEVGNRRGALATIAAPSPSRAPTSRTSSPARRTA
jgi:guanosine-3',5'-bis(diphosphate) 3'-pyrophosphohydrolase